VVVEGIKKDAPADNWPVWGALDKDAALQAFRHFYNFPYRVKPIKIEKKGDLQTAIRNFYIRRGWFRPVRIYSLLLHNHPYCKYTNAGKGRMESAGCIFFTLVS
jgi:hypothetical protein